MSKIYNSITDLIGNTPIIQLHHIVPEGAAEVYVKLESFNPGFICQRSYRSSYD